MRTTTTRLGQFEIGERARDSGVLSYTEFLELAEWKTSRTKSRYRSNTPASVAEITGHALPASEPRFQIEVLRLLDAIDWATASVILHFCYRERWPILDVRAFWSLGRVVPKHITYPL